MSLLFKIAPAIISCLLIIPSQAGTSLSSVLTPDVVPPAKVQRQARQSFYDYRYGVPRPLYERLEYVPARCGRCLEDRYDDRDNDYDRRRNRDKYDDDDDRRTSHRPTSGSRHDRNRDNDSEEDKKYSGDRWNADKNTNGTNDDQGDDKTQYDDDKDDRKSHRNRDRHRDRDSHRNRYDDRDRYRPDYYDRFLRDPYRERPYYEDPYRERRPVYDRYPAYDEGYGGRFDGYAATGYRRPVYDQYDRGNGYDDAYGGYAPGVGRGPHDSFRPWDETYRGQAGWDAGGRGYYFASGRPEAAARPGQTRYPQGSERAGEQASGWQNVGYQQSGYPNYQQYQGSFGYPDTGRQSGWYSAGERRPYRDQSGVNKLDNRNNYGQGQNNADQNAYGQTSTYGQKQPSTYGQSNRDSYGQNDRGAYGQNDRAYGQNDRGAYGQNDRGQSTYGQSNRGTYSQSDRGYGQSSTYGQNDRGTYDQSNSQSDRNGYGQSSSSTTPVTSYLYEREDEQVTTKESADESTKTPS